MLPLRTYADEIAVALVVLIVVAVNCFHRELPFLARELGRGCRDLGFLLFGPARDNRV